MNMIKTYIDLYFQKKEPITIKFLLDQLWYNFGLSLRHNTLSHIIKGMEGVKIVTGYPMENTRIQVPEEKIREFYSYLGSISKDVPPGFIFNCDESGFSHWTYENNISETKQLRYDFGSI